MISIEEYRALPINWAVYRDVYRAVSDPVNWDPNRAVFRGVYWDVYEAVSGAVFVPVSLAFRKGFPND